MSKQPRPTNTKMTSFTGVFLLIFSVFVVVFDTANFFAIGISFLIMPIGVMLVMVGAIWRLRKENQKQAQLTQKLLERSSRSDANTATH